MFNKLMTSYTPSAHHTDNDDVIKFCVCNQRFCHSEERERKKKKRKIQIERQIQGDIDRQTNRQTDK